MHEVSPRPIHVIWLYLTRCNQGIANAGAVESLLARRAQPDRAFDSKQWIWLQSFATVAAGADQRSNIFRPRPKPRVRIVIILVECVRMAPFMRSGVRQTNVCRMSSRCYSLLHLKATDPRV